MANDRYREIFRTSLVGIGGNVALTAMKVVVGLLAGSIAIVLDALNSLTDAISSVVTIIGAKIASMRPSRKHPFGYGRVEYLTSIIIAAIILAAGGASLYESILKVITPVEPDYRMVTLAVLIVAIIVKIFMGLYFVKQGKSIKSQPLYASGIDALYDAILTAGTLVAAIICMLWHIDVDGWVGAIISLFILKAGFDILREGISPILGERPNKELTHKIQNTIAGHENVLGVYDLFIDSFGPETAYAGANIEVPDDMVASEIYELTRQIEQDVFVQCGVRMIVGIYAANAPCPYRPIRAKLEEEVAKYPEIVQIHGFYVNQTKKKVDFDMVVDFKNDSESARAEILKTMNKAFPDYQFDIVIDSSYAD